MATPASADLFAKGEVRQTSTAELYADFTARKSATADFKALLTVRQPGTAELSATFDVGQNSANLKGVMLIQGASTKEMLGYFILINDTGVISQGIDASVLQALGVIS